jgi:hypothetical protein
MYTREDTRQLILVASGGLTVSWLAIAAAFLFWLKIHLLGMVAWGMGGSYDAALTPGDWQPEYSTTEPGVAVRPMHYGEWFALVSLVQVRMEDGTFLVPRDRVKLEPHAARFVLFGAGVVLAMAAVQFATTRWLLERQARSEVKAAANPTRKAEALGGATLDYWHAPRQRGSVSWRLATAFACHVLLWATLSVVAAAVVVGFSVLLAAELFRRPGRVPRWPTGALYVAVLSANIGVAVMMIVLLA